ncbi:unnamed protein product [Phaedon cochleariae]|uniref:Uncharacterized protein n=1 Tax=Phaedon cochleariae TaxID=80249 RepID=A0A9N9SDR5_PHACE|nr:unnamed protein product [Phaedon cochleariae]
MDMNVGDFKNQYEPKHATPPKAIGVIGIGVMSGELVKNLIKSGYNVNIWSRNGQKCEFLHTNLGHNMFAGKLKTLLSARAVLKNSDIVFNCVSDHIVSKKIIRTNFGLNNASDTILQGKGFIEMTPIEPTASLEIKEMIEMKGGKYLEAQAQTNKLGGILILTGGNKSLFDTCNSCFEAIGYDALYYGEVGHATIINLIIQQLKAVCIAALSEGFAFAHECGIKEEDFLQIMESITDTQSKYLMDKANMIVKKSYTNVQQSLSNMHKQLTVASDVSREVVQPMFLASSLSEIMKSCQRTGYGNHDVSAIRQYYH